MERIESLIYKLKEQYEQQADPALLLGTVQLIQFELSRLTDKAPLGLGTAKVAVVLPAVPVARQAVEMATVTPAMEKYMPPPAAGKIPATPAPVPVVNEIPAEPVELPVPKKGTQVDLNFDPMTEIPTLSQQAKGAEVNDHSVLAESLNDRLNQGKTELMEVLKDSPVKDLRKAIGINDRFVFMNELFRGDENMYERSIRTINNFNILAEAEYWISRELKLKLGWDNSSATVIHFDQLIRRRFS